MSVEVAEKGVEGAVAALNGGSGLALLDRPSPVRDALGRFPPGVSGNPRGMRAAGASYVHWLNVLGDTAHSRGGTRYLKAIAKCETEPILKRRAAETLLRAGRMTFSRAGKPEAGDDLDRICDRTSGKPTQTIAVAHIEVAPMVLGDEMRAILAANPLLLAEVRASADAAALPIVEGEVVEGEGGGAQSGD